MKLSLNHLAALAMICGVALSVVDPAANERTIAALIGFATGAAIRGRSKV